MKFLRLLMLAMFATFATAYVRAAADTDVAAGVTTFTDTWTAVKVPMISVGVFLLCWGLIKKLRRA